MSYHVKETNPPQSAGEENSSTTLSAVYAMSERSSRTMTSLKRERSFAKAVFIESRYPSCPFSIPEDRMTLEQSASHSDIQNVLMLYRNDELGTNGEKLHFQHWADIVDCGYTWYRQNKVGGTTNANINSAMLYAFVDPSSPAGGISTEGWETLWKYCAEGKYSSDDTYKYGFDPLNKGDVAVSTFYSSSLYGKIDAAAESSEHPLKGAMTPENWDLVEIDDGTYYIAEYIGILDKAGRTEEETEAVKAFAEWFGSAETQAAWGEEFDSYPCNTAAADILYPAGTVFLQT